MASKLKKKFPKYETIQFVLYDGFLPTGQMTGGPAYIGAGVPKECPFTPSRDWQKKN